MRGRSISLTVVCLLVCFSGAPAWSDIQEMVWQNVSNDIMDTDLREIVANTNSVYVSSLNAVYRTTNKGKTWDEILSFRGTGNVINTLAVSPQNTEIVFAGTREGLYRSIDAGRTWERIFKGIGEMESSVLSIANHPVNPETIFIGTINGIYRKGSSYHEWIKGRNFPDKAPVVSLAIDIYEPYSIYAATDTQLYKSINNGADWERIFTANISESEILTLNNSGAGTEEPNSEVENGIESPTDIFIKNIVVDPFDSKTIYLGTVSGLLISKDQGLTWKKSNSAGLINHNIRHIAVNSQHIDNLYAASGRGVFMYSKSSEKWEELYKGIVSQDVRHLATVNEHEDAYVILWAATKKGVFKTTSSSKNDEYFHKDIGAEKALSEFDHEPTIEEIRNAAIKYSEVSPDKIERWRKAAARKALLPDLKFEYQKNKDWSKGTYFYSNSTEKYKDDDITVNRDKEWSISLTWELGELIWNNDQTSIDSRSKLMVELRDEIVNEVTRLYFERRRMQIEMLLSPVKDVKEKIDKELRLQELTADIDALTGSYLSKKLAKIINRDEM